MGWFDESDDDDNEDNTAKKDISEIPNKIHYEDDEDPLDAFMNALQKTTESKPNAPRAERLDVDNDDDEKYQAFNEIRENDLDDWNDDTMVDPHSKMSLSDQKALSEKFVKAGSKNTNVSIQLDVVNHEKMQYFPFRKLLLNPQDTPFGREWRRQEGVTCSPVTMDPITSFESISKLLGKELLHRINSSGYHSPTPVQAQTLAVALAGRDALVTASTGSGKTLAYVWPMVLHIQERNCNTPSGPMGLILVPTREIATQVQKHVHTMIKSSIAIIGGVNRYELVQSLNRNPARIVVATPGRLLDVLSIKKNGFSLCHVTFVVLDECDRMLDMGFESQVKEILLQIRPDRQSLLLSATLGRKIEAVAQKWLKDSIRISVGQTGRASDHVKQHVMVLPDFQAKKEWLQQMVPVLVNVGLTLVFVATRIDCETVADVLRQPALSSNISIATLHGDKHTSDRQKVLKGFIKGQVNVLVATDVAARGIDVNVATVVCFDPAKNLDTHVHRIGRAGRLAKNDQEYREGNAYTLLTAKDADFAQVLLNAFERDRREINPDFRELAQKSRKSGNISDTRERWNKAGLGFSSEQYYGPASSAAAAEESRHLNDYSDTLPTSKKSRWN